MHLIDLVYRLYSYNEKYFSVRATFSYIVCVILEGTKDALCHKLRGLTIGQNYCSAQSRVAIETHS
jgi:hypothetical protein